MKFKIDTKSIKFKSWLYFILFAAVLMAALWIVQVLMLNNLYGTMKTAQTQKVAIDIEESFKSNDSEDFFNDVADFSDSHDMYIYVVSLDGTAMYFSPSSGDYDMSALNGSSDAESKDAEAPSEN